MNRRVFFACAVAVIVVVILIARPYHLSLLIFAGIDALAAAGIVLLMRAGQVSLGHAAFIGIGAYVSAILARDYNWSPWLSIVAGIISAALAAVPIGLVTLRLREMYLPLATLAWGMAFHVLFMAAAPITGGASGFDRIPALTMFGVPIGGDKAFAALVWLIVIVTVAVLAQLMRSRQGRAIRALREHDQMAVAFGINPARLKMQVFIVSAALAGLSGALYTFQTRFISPSPFGIGQSFTLLIVAILGGAGYPAGAVVGAVLVAVINLVLQTLFSGLIDRVGPIEPVIFGVLLIVLLLKWPDGIWSAIEARLSKVVFNAPNARSERAPVQMATRGVGEVPLLELIDVSKSFGGIQALRHLSLRVSAGQIVGLIGPNGAGKSTAFNVMSGLLLPTTGSVCLAGQSLPPEPWAVTAGGIARTFQHVKLVGDMSVIENVAVGAYTGGHANMLAGMSGIDRDEEKRVLARAFEALSLVGLTDSANILAGTLPLGKQRLVEIARALAAEPTLLLLDEPAAGLRATEKRELISLLYKLKADGISVVLVEHDMDLVMRAVDHLIVLDRGELLAEGTPASIRKDRKVIDAYLGAAA